MEYNFPAIMTETKKWEGGYVNHPRDPGGSTNMGVTQSTLDAERRAHPRDNLPHDVRSLTIEDVTKIYRRSYWAAVRGDKLPGGLDHVAFDGAVNSGPSRGAKWLQQGVGSPADGKIGPKTLAAAEALGPKARMAAITKACDARRGFLRGLRIFDTFGKGWMRRVNGVEAHAHVLAGTEREAAAEAKVRAKREEQTGAVGAGSAVGAVGGAEAYGDILTTVPWPVLAIAGVIVALLIFNQVGRAQNDRKRAEVIEATKRSA